MLFGETAGGKSTMAELVAHVMKKRLTRIQINQRTDEYDMFGSFHPVEVEMTDPRAVEILLEVLSKTEGEGVEISKIRKAFRGLKISDEKAKAALGETADGLEGDDLKITYLRTYVLRAGARGKDPIAKKQLHDFAKMMVNGIAGIELRFKKGIFLEAYERGDVVLLDEVNLANEECLGILYQLLTLGYVQFQGKPIKPGKGFQLIVSGNPSTYAGRNRMSEAFMNRYEIHYVRSMSKEEMVEVLMEKFELKARGVSKKQIEKLVEMQFEIDERSQDGKFDEFNVGQTYKFSIRNLERVIEDSLKRRVFEKGRDLFEIITDEAYMEYENLLSQSTDEDVKGKNNSASLRDFFKNHLGIEIPEEGLGQEYKLKTETVDGEEWAGLNGVRVRKLQPADMLDQMQVALNDLIKDGVIKGENGEMLCQFDDHARAEILDRARAEKQKSLKSESLKDFVIGAARDRYLAALGGTEENRAALDSLIEEYFRTQAERIDRLVELKSIGRVRAQILKGFRDGYLRKEKSSDGKEVLIHKSRPVLLVGHPGGGKTEMVGDIARDLNWPYMSVSLGAATIESLIGSFIIDEDTGTFIFKKGVLVQAMERGYALVLEEINMAESGIIEVLNEYFDRGTMTIQEKSVPVKIHENFRLFATMNPTEGRTGRNAGRIGLSPALRSRFREVWVRGQRPTREQYRIMLSGIQSLVKDVLAKGGLPKEEEMVDLWELHSGRVTINPPAKMQKVGSPIFMSDVSGSPGFSENPAEDMGSAFSAEGSRKPPRAPSEWEWGSMSLAERARIYEETFRAVSHGAVSLRQSKGEFWAFSPDTNTLFYPKEAIMQTSLEAAIGAAIHESMHRYGTRYTTYFSEFLDEKKLGTGD